MVPYRSLAHLDATGSKGRGTDIYGIHSRQSLPGTNETTNTLPISLVPEADAQNSSCGWLASSDKSGRWVTMAQMYIMKKKG